MNNDKNNQKKDNQLGMAGGTASNRLRKMVLFDLLKRHSENICFRCESKIETPDDLSIEHKRPWLDSHDPIRLFFDLDNIAFSHLTCNIGARRTYPQERVGHGHLVTYNKHGCRCDKCREAVATSKRNRERKHSSLV